jgi:phage shock protein PspC (stress-responsive transcriptional regulator)
MMRLRDWPARRIGRMWLGGCALEALLVAALISTGDPPPKSDPPRAREAPAAAPVEPSSPEEVDSALRQLGISVTRERLPSGHTRTRFRRDSSYMVAEVRGDTSAIVEASPDVEQAFGNMANAWGAAMEGLVRLLLIVAAVLLPVPVLLVAITLAWAMLRRRERRSAHRLTIG